MSSVLERIGRNIPGMEFKTEGLATAAHRRKRTIRYHEALKAGRVPDQPQRDVFTITDYSRLRWKARQEEMKGVTIMTEISWMGIGIHSHEAYRGNTEKRKREPVSPIEIRQEAHNDLNRLLQLYPDAETRTVEAQAMIDRDQQVADGRDDFQDPLVF